MPLTTSVTRPPPETVVISNLGSFVDSTPLWAIASSKSNSASTGA